MIPTPAPPQCNTDTLDCPFLVIMEILLSCSPGARGSCVHSCCVPAVPSPVHDCDRTPLAPPRIHTRPPPVLTLLLFPLRTSRPWRRSLTVQASRSFGSCGLLRRVSLWVVAGRSGVAPDGGRMLPGGGGDRDGRCARQRRRRRRRRGRINDGEGSERKVARIATGWDNFLER